MSEPRRYSVRASDGVELALHHLSGRDDSGLASSTPVLLAPGAFCTRSFWLGTRGQGFGPMLAAAGWDVWILEPRGHGHSAGPRVWTMDDWILRDAPAALAVVLEETGADDCFWVGHSAGGVVGAALAGSPAAAERLRGLVLLCAPGPAGIRGPRRWAARAVHLATAAVPWVQIPGEPLGLGPEHEPAPMIGKWMRWNLEGAWRRPDGGDYLAPLPRVRVPLLAVAGGRDRIAPEGAVRDLASRFGSADRTVVVAGRRDGFQADYGHGDLVASRGARHEVWPVLLNWMRERTPRSEAPMPYTETPEPIKNGRG